ncbi:MAG: Hpt domain-containing protein [Oligoflexia bacterium]|nr:Hpt domain-containing protein [Oligoflexia bacterium]
MTVLDSDLLAEFLEEAEEGVATLNEDLLHIEEELNEGLSINTESLNDMFRVAHSIKGASAFFSLNKTNSLTHELESLMDLFRCGTLELNKEHANLIFSALDILNKLFMDIRQEGEEKSDITGVLDKISSITSGYARDSEAKISDVAFVKNVLEKNQPEKKDENEQKTADTEPEKSTEYKASDYLNEFLAETEENLTALNDAMLLLEKEPENEEELHSAFRLAHTIKGSAGLLGYTEINKLMHSLEDLLAMARAKKVALDSRLISYGFRLIDQVEKSLKNLRNTGQEGFNSADLLKEFKDEVDKALSSVPEGISADDASQASDDGMDEEHEDSVRVLEAKAAKPDRAAKRLYRVSVYIDGDTSLKSIRAILIMKKLSEIGDILNISPDVDSIDNIQTKEDLAVIYIVKTTADRNDLINIANVDTVKKVLVEEMSEQHVDSVPKGQTQTAPQAGTISVKTDTPGPVYEEEIIEGREIRDEIKKKVSIIQTVRVDIKKLDNLMNLAGELVITKAIYGQLLLKLQKYIVSMSEDIGQLTASLNKLDNLFSSVNLNIAAGKRMDSNFSKKLSDMLGEIKEIIKILGSEDFINVITEFDDNTSRLGKISGDIQSDVMLARMVPIYGVFNRFKRMIRDLSVELKKEVKLEIYGEETELDKKIIDEISDPLTHMVRNAMDHGFEPVAERIAAGKTPFGTLKLEANHRGNSVYVSVSDDGRGIDPNRIARKALAKGLITQEKLELMSDKEKVNLVFIPGFSIVDEVTSLSGRGVGMDVVLKMVENLGGNVSIDSELGKGSSVTIRIPLTLAIIKALLVNIGKQIYAFPLDTVTEVVKIPNDEIYSIDGNYTIKLRGAPIALLELTDLIGIDSDYEVDKNINDNKVTIVIISDGSTHIGVKVDSLIGGEEIVIKSLSEHFNDVVGISGASILGNGAIAQILDVGAIIRSAE